MNANSRLLYSHVIDTYLHLGFVVLVCQYFRLIIFSLGLLGDSTDGGFSSVFALYTCF